jgi:hypothetical protein
LSIQSKNSSCAIRPTGRREEAGPREEEIIKEGEEIGVDEGEADIGEGEGDGHLETIILTTAHL